MTTPVVNSKIAIRFMPSLFHLALVKVALPLLHHEFDYKTLEKTFTEIQPGNSTVSDEGSEEIQPVNSTVSDEGSEEIQPGNSTVSDEGSEEIGDVNCDRVKEKLLCIPRHLRKNLVQSVIGMQNAVLRWQRFHYYILGLKVRGFTFYWRSDGTIDTTKTAEELIVNENITTRQRFEIACFYCFEKRIKTLWAEMKASGETVNFEAANNCMTRFWVRWLREGSKVPWTQAAPEYLVTSNAMCCHNSVARYASFLPLLLPKNRRKFLQAAYCADLGDMLTCLYALTVEEEKEHLERDVLSILFPYLQWPFQSLFLETAEKVANYMDAESFCRVILVLLEGWEYFDRNDYDYDELLSDFWNRSPLHLRESLKEYPPIDKKMDDFLKGEKRKRKADHHEGTTTKKMRLDTPCKSG